MARQSLQSGQTDKVVLNYKEMEGGNMENWDYALLSEKAKAAGGPDKLVEQLVEQGRQLGAKQTWSKVGIGIGAAGAAVGLSAIVYYFANAVVQKKKKAEIEKLKAELIQGIKEYDKQQDANKADNMA